MNVVHFGRNFGDNLIYLETQRVSNRLIIEIPYYFIYVFEKSLFGNFKKFETPPTIVYQGKGLFILDVSSL